MTDMPPDEKPAASTASSAVAMGTSPSFKSCCMDEESRLRNTRRRLPLARPKPADEPPAPSSAEACAPKAVPAPAPMPPSAPAPTKLISPNAAPPAPVKRLAVLGDFCKNSVSDDFKNSFRVIHLSAKPTTVMIFTAACVEVAIHYLNISKEFFHCNGNACAACEAQIAKYARLLLPVINPFEREVELLPIPIATELTAPLPKLLAATKFAERRGAYTAQISRSNGIYDVKIDPVPNGREFLWDLGNRFLSNLHTGTIDLRNSIATLSNTGIKALIAPETTSRPSANAAQQ